MTYYSCDFETTTNKSDCRVWAFGACNIYNLNDFYYGLSIEDFIEWCKLLPDNTTKLYFHNLKFDGEFIISWLLRNGYKCIKNTNELDGKSFSVLVNDKGQFYSLNINFKGRNKHKKGVRIYDSLKVLPFKVEEIAYAFNLLMIKGEIDYNKVRPIGYKLDKNELSYLYRDCAIVAQGLKYLFDNGLTKITTGSNALYEYKQIIGTKNFKYWFPIPYYDKEIREAYRGGYTYLNPKFKNKELGKGIVLDVNSLYPAMMMQLLPYGEGIFFKGKYDNDKDYPLYVQMVEAQFELKENYLPTLQSKTSIYGNLEYLENSGDDIITLCLTNIDLDLFYRHYNITYINFISGWKFRGSTELFKDYINKWYKIKSESTINNNKPMRTISKLMLNSLYGKFGLNPHIQTKEPYLDDEGVVKYRPYPEEFRNPIYIPIAVFITSYARHKTISSAQLNYERFIYSDTDSLHLIGDELPNNLDIDNVKIGAWKHESSFKRAKFLRAKCYIEDEENQLKITCAGLPKNCYKNVSWENFSPSAKYSGKLIPKRVKNGVILEETLFTIKE